MQGNCVEITATLVVDVRGIRKNRWHDNSSILFELE